MSFLFSVTYNCFQFYISSNVSIDLLQYSNLIIHQRARSLFRDPESRVPLEHLGSQVMVLTKRVPNPESHMMILESQVTGRTYGDPVPRTSVALFLYDEYQMTIINFRNPESVSQGAHFIFIKIQSYQFFLSSSYIEEMRW